MSIEKKETLKVKIEEKWKDVKWKAREKTEDTLNWIYNNKEMVVIAAPVVAGALKVTAKAVGGAMRSHNQDKAIKNRDMRCYDPSQGHYWELKRKLSSNEWMRVNDRHKKGESLGDILSSMNVLK